MYQHKLERDIRCPLDYGLSIFGGKWKSRIICVLSQADRPLRYSVLRQSMGNITDAVLSASLRELSADQMVERIQYAEIPPRVEYRLTPRGESVIPILKSIAAWAGAFDRGCDGQNMPHCQRCDYNAAEG